MIINILHQLRIKRYELQQDTMLYKKGTIATKVAQPASNGDLYYYSVVLDNGVKEETFAFSIEGNPIWKRKWI